MKALLSLLCFQPIVALALDQFLHLTSYPLPGYIVSQYGIQSDDHRRADRHHEARPG